MKPINTDGLSGTALEDAKRENREWLEKARAAYVPPDMRSGLRLFQMLASITEILSKAHNQHQGVSVSYVATGGEQGKPDGGMKIEISVAPNDPV